jgi:hypothetical protein
MTRPAHRDLMLLRKLKEAQNLGPLTNDDYEEVSRNTELRHGNTYVTCRR